MPTDTGENNANVAVSSNASNNINKRLTKNGGTPPPEQEHLPCPRCDSTNTKFCYYNNYNFSQPRHFCKSCRRYWTHGGTLRDIPVGGGTRKNAKRSRTAAHNSASSILAANASLGQDYPLTSTPVLVPYQGAASAQFCGGDLKGCAGNVGSGTFTSLLNTQGPGTGFLALGGFGLGLGSGLVGDVGFGGLGRGVWNFAGLGDAAAAATLGGGNGNAGSGGVGGATGMGNTWQFESGETTAGFVGADCFAWPDLAISTPGNGLK